MSRKLTIYGIDWNYNKVLELAKQGPFIYASAKKKQETAIVLQIKRLPKVEHKAKYVFNWYEADRRKDPDGIATGQKVVFDSMQLAGLIENDGWNQIGGIEHRYFVDKKDPRLELEII